MLLVDHHHLERGGAAENAFCARRVLHSRQLHHNPAVALALNNRLRDPQFVNPVAQRGDVLFQGELGQLIDLALRKTHGEDIFGAPGPFGHDQGGKFVADRLQCVLGRLC